MSSKTKQDVQSLFNVTRAVAAGFVRTLVSKALWTEVGKKPLEAGTLGRRLTLYSPADNWTQKLATILGTHTDRETVEREFEVGRSDAYGFINALVAAGLLIGSEKIDRGHGIKGKRPSYFEVVPNFATCLGAIMDPDSVGALVAAMDAGGYGKQMETLKN